MDPIAYPRPAPLEQRVKFRGCKNCVYFQHSAGLCAINSPAQQPPPEKWCGQWAWIVNTRVRWESAFAPLELKGDPLESPSK